MNPQALEQMQNSSTFQQAIDTIEALPLETQEVLITIIQNRLRAKRRLNLLEAVLDSERAYEVGNVKRGTVADFLAELDDLCKSSGV